MKVMTPKCPGKAIRPVGRSSHHRPDADQGSHRHDLACGPSKRHLGSDNEDERRAQDDHDLFT